MCFTACEKTSKTPRTTNTNREATTYSREKQSREKALSTAKLRCQLTCATDSKVGGGRNYDWTYGTVDIEESYDRYEITLMGTFWSEDAYGDSHRWKFSWSGYVKYGYDYAYYHNYNVEKGY